MRMGEGELARRRTSRLASRALRRGGTVVSAGGRRGRRVRLGFFRVGVCGSSDEAGSLVTWVCRSLLGLIYLRFLEGSNLNSSSMFLTFFSDMSSG